MTRLLEGHLAFITGGGSGIGRGIAIGYAREGARVIVADVNVEGAKETVRLVEEAGGSCWSFELDVSNIQACQALASKVAAEIGTVSVLVNNAGIVRRATLDTENAIEDWYDTIAVNVNGVFNTTYAFLDQLKQNKGRIINLGSIQSFVHTPNSVAYTTSKGAVLNFTKGLAAELGPHGVRVNAIGPGFIETPLNQHARETNPELKVNFLKHTPLGRSGLPDDIVGPAIFLASDLSQYVTGVLVPSDGGYLTV